MRRSLSRMSPSNRRYAASIRSPRKTPAKPRAARGISEASVLQSTSMYSSGRSPMVKAATSSAGRPAAIGKPNSADPEHSEMIEGRTPASSSARAAPTTDASAPLPPVATRASR